LSPGGGSGVYVRMRAVAPTEDLGRQSSHYMNVLYNAVQDHPDDFVSVESALSPYLAMSGAKKTSLPDAHETVMRSTSDRKAKGRSRSNSASRLHEVTSGCRKKLTASLSSSSSKTSSKSKALAEFRELMQEVERKRHYRVGLNIFNSKPELGVEYLVQKNFLELSPAAVARFLLENACLSREKVGEYLGCLQNPFCMKVLSCFTDELDFAGMRIDKALRLLMQNVRVSGEAQKIERMMEVFGKRYNKCNPSFANKLRAQDSVVTLAFAVMLLNTDLHTPTLKEEKKMSVDAFVNNLRGVDSGRDFDSKLLKTIYKGIKKQELTCVADHVTQTLAIQQSLVPSSSMGVRRTLSSSSSGSNSFSSSHQSQSSLPQLVEPHRRLVCLCRLYEVTDMGARDSNSVATEHPRDVFLFNDVMLLTKRSGNGNGPAATYTFRELTQLRGLEVTLFRTPAYAFGVQVSRKRDKSVVAMFNAGSEHDRFKFVMDLQESIFEMDLMEKVLRDFNR
jgi:IQ motif/SEC7 domain-containing protein